MGNTAVATYRGRFIQVSFTDSGADWYFATDTNVPIELRNLGSLEVKSITFVPSAANDKCVIKEASDTGPTIFEAISLETTSGVVNESKMTYNRGTCMRPYFDLSDSALGTPANAKILIELA